MRVLTYRIYFQDAERLFPARARALLCSVVQICLAYQYGFYHGCQLENNLEMLLIGNKF